MNDFQYLIDNIKIKTPEETKKDLIRLGVITEDGKLTPKYETPPECKIPKTVYKMSIVDQTGEKFCIFDSIQEVLEEVEIVLQETNDKFTIQAIAMSEEEISNLQEFEGW